MTFEVQNIYKNESNSWLKKSFPNKRNRLVALRSDIFFVSTDQENCEMTEWQVQVVSTAELWSALRHLDQTSFETTLWNYETAPPHLLLKIN